MKKKTKFIIEVSVYAIILLAVVLGVTLALIKPTRIYDAVIERNGTQKEATLTMKYNLLSRCLGKLDGTISVETKDGLNSVEYTLKDQRISYEEPDMNSAYVWVDVAPGHPHGAFFHVGVEYDKGFENIILYSKEDKYVICAASDEFLELNWWRVEDCFESAETE